MRDFIYYYSDWTYLLVLVAAVFSLIASARVKLTFHKYDKMRSANGLTGAEVAHRILRGAGLVGVRVERTPGALTDHYDPRDHVLRLSDATYNSSSVAAAGIAAHECGHAIQHEEEYMPLKLRGLLVPAANIGSRLGIPLVILGMFLIKKIILLKINTI